MKNKDIMRDKVYFQKLSERYFDALTTVAEERELRNFLLHTKDRDFDEIKAVMFVMESCGRRHDVGSRKKNHGHVWRTIGYAAAAVAVLMVLPCLRYYKQQQEEKIICEQMMLFFDSQEPVIDEQMIEMIN